MFCSIDEVFNWLYNERKAQRRENLNRITECAKALDLNPEYKIIHITGTNGKGSVAMDIKNILSNTGIHVGFFVSPFVISFNERIQINDRYISNAEILHYANLLYPFAEEYKREKKDTIPFFELTLLMALLFFRDRKIDLAVIECGLGGKLDATNFLPSDLSIITNVGYDHMLQLGNTKEEIAEHKMGIMKPNTCTITAVEESLLPRFQAHAEEINSKLIYVDSKNITNISLGSGTAFTYKGVDYKTSLLGIFQAYNASIAIEAVKYIDPTIPEDIIRYGLETVRWPGRMEIIEKNPCIILDGGHNISAIEASMTTMKALREHHKVKVMFTALMDKDYTAMLHALDEVADFYYFTSITDLRATNPIAFMDKTKKPCKVIPDLEECIRVAKLELGKDEILWITGSLHFISMVREKLI